MAAGYVGFRSRAMARKRCPHILCRQEPAPPAKGRIFRKIRPVAGKRRVSIPNIITLGRILLVPIIVWAIASSQMEIAFAIFIVAGVSDAVDGFLAKRFNMASELWSPARSPGRQGAPGLDLRGARHLGRGAALDRHPGGLARHHDRRRRDRVVAVRQADFDEAVDGVEAEHCGAGRVRRFGAGSAWIWL